MRQKFVRIVVGWFRLLGARRSRTTRSGIPRTFFGAHYYDCDGRRGRARFMSGQLDLRLGRDRRRVRFCWRRPSCDLRRMHSVRATSLDRRKCRDVTRAGRGAGLLADRIRFTATLHADQPADRTSSCSASIPCGWMNWSGSAARPGNTPHIDRVPRGSRRRQGHVHADGAHVRLLGRHPDGTQSAATGARNNLTPRDAGRARIRPSPTSCASRATARSIPRTRSDSPTSTNPMGSTRSSRRPSARRTSSSGTYNELPLASVVINTRLGQLLFPFSYGNRGAAPGVRAEDVSWRGWTVNSSSTGPTFLIVHLTAAHWPYYTAETPFGVSVKKYPDDRPMYRIGLRTADACSIRSSPCCDERARSTMRSSWSLSDHGEAMRCPTTRS